MKIEQDDKELSEENFKLKTELENLKLFKFNFELQEENKILKNNIVQLKKELKESYKNNLLSILNCPMTKLNLEMILTL